MMKTEAEIKKVRNVLKGLGVPKETLYLLRWILDETPETG